ncbi:MAG: bacteriorhodopsin [Halobellus sp.]|uniref:bacteriorhodopsin n=1 Tax=Halobellus sp. TaxID=1979212 RepID=UPI0035D471D3
MEPSTLAHWAATAAFAGGTAIAALLYKSVGESEARSWLAYIAIIPGFAGLSYIGIALGIGTISVNGTQFVGLRYLDWIVTTPLLVGFVGFVAGASRRTIAGVMIADALMIVFGAGAVLTTGLTKWAFFGISSLFHLSLFAWLYYVFPKQVPDNPRQIGLFSLLKNHIGLLWLAYPFVWLMGPAGLEYVTLAGADLTFVFLDVMAKVPYVYFFYARQSVFQDGVISAGKERSVAPAD